MRKVVSDGRTKFVESKLLSTLFYKELFAFIRKAKFANYQLMKKIFFLVALVASFSAQASNFNGSFVGAAIGKDFAEINYSSHDLTYDSITKRRYALSGTQEGLTLGYGKAFNHNVYLGLEATGDISQTKTREDFVGTGSSQYLTMERKNGYSALVKLGYVFPSENILTYVAGGYGWATWRAEEFNSTSDKAIDAKQSLVSGIKYGAGIAFMPQEHLRFDLGLYQTDYNNFSDRVTTYPNQQKDVDYKPSDFSALLSASYVF